jgi:hypothetical protein
MKYPRAFAGVVSLGGPFPSGDSPLAYFDQARQVPLFIAQSRLSTHYSADAACRDLRLFHTAGMNVTLRQYPGDVELNAQILHDMNVWIMEQVTGINHTETERLTPQRGDEG